MSQYRKWVWALIVLISLLGFGLRLFRLSNQSFWLDEVGSINTARAEWKEIYRKSSEQNSLPTYFILLRPIAGTSHKNAEIRTRLFSVLAGSLSVPLFIGVIYLWRRNWRTALFAGLLLAVNPLHLWYSQETRNYALMLFFGLCCLLAFEFARTSRKLWWWAAYWLFAVLALATHKTGLVFPLLCAMRQFWDTRGVRLPLRALAHYGVLAVIALFLLLQPANPPLKEFGRPSSFLEVPYTAMTFLDGYSFGPSVTEIQNLGAWPAVLRHPVQTAIVVIIVLVILGTLLAKCRGLLFEREAVLISLGVGLAVFGAIISHFPFNVRYTLPALFGFLALIAAIVSSLNSVRSSQVLILSVLVVSAWADFQWYYDFNYRKGDSRAVAQWLVENQQRIKSFTVLPDYLDTTFKWYLDGKPELLAALQPPTHSQSTTFPPVPDLLMISRRHHLLKPDAVIENYRAEVGELETNDSFAGFELYVRKQPQAEKSGVNSAGARAGR